jgi:hypothetical protein
MVGVGEKVEERQARKREAVGGEADGVPEQGGRVAGEVSDRADGASADGFDESGRQASPWVQDDQVEGVSFAPAA